MEDQQKQSLILRDQLAVDRTHMANERTLMSFIRTALMIFASGVTLIKIYDNAFYLDLFGWLLLPVAVVIAITAFARFVRMKKRIDHNS